ncbi:AraC family transcriptional regulator [Cupriavidus basilensis]|uniref:AraC family transcriptional regulator n=1 Tax=Cupriavidus basilensis TaxID=68895 RepID=A0ABT6AYV0_9BURK|nr:AraC family transcriptional regulator [Cupriavidus basilensis]MDF3837783.1 AraC family transcriptional regulator [Cupriavidus basilensis]
MEKHSVAICFVHHAIAGLRSRGIAPEPVLQAAGIAPALLAVPQARVSSASYSALWLGVAAALDDEFFGQDSRRMKCGSFAMLCHAVAGSRTLAQGLERVVRYFRLLLDDIGVRLEREGVGQGEAEGEKDGSEDPARRGRRAALVLAATSDRAPGVFAQETMLIMLHGLMSWLMRRRVPVLLAAFSYPEPPYAAEYRLMYSRHLAFDQPATALVFDAAWLDQPVHQDERSLKAFLRDAPHNVVVKYTDRASVMARVRRQLRAQAPEQWPTFDRLAHDVHMSPSSLRRRLMEEGGTYQQLKDEMRRDLAIEALSHSSRPLAEIAAELGFAEPGAFHRAFRRWTGLRPGAYRATPAQA